MVFAKNFDESFAPGMADEEASELFQKMEPKVECTTNSMRLNIRDSTPRMMLAVERGRNSLFSTHFFLRLRLISTPLIN